MISKFPRWVWLGGGALTFSAGLVNAVAFLNVSHQAATHVTGIVSHLSIAVYEQDKARATEAFFSALFFLSGAILSGMIIRDGHLKMGRRYGAALSLESCLLFASAAAFRKAPVLGGYLACMASGLQNGLVSNYSGAILRTTHLTGIFTDLGVLVGHWFRGMAIDFRRVKLFLILIFSFTAGGFLGAFLFRLWDVDAMLVPASLIAAAALVYYLLQHKAPEI